MSRCFTWLFLPQAGHFAQLPQLIYRQAKQSRCPAFVNAPFSNWLVHLYSSA
jgi:hypothetical protein